MSTIDAAPLTAAAKRDLAWAWSSLKQRQEAARQRDALLLEWAKLTPRKRQVLLTASASRDGWICRGH